MDVPEQDPAERNASPVAGRAPSGAGVDPPPARHVAARIPLRTLGEVARELARVYRAVKGGTLEDGRGKTLTYILATLRGVLESSDLERRVAALEQHHDEQP